MRRDAAARAQLAQQRRIAGFVRTEREIVPAEHLLCAQRAHEHLVDELLGAEHAELLKRRAQRRLDAAGLHAAQLFARREDGLALARAAVRQRERERRRRQPAARSGVHRGAQHGPVADVHAVKIAQRHGAVAGSAPGAQGWIVCMSCKTDHSLPQKIFSCVSTPARTAPTPTNSPPQ